ncbi:MAG: 3-phosphoshikimate 1-carboxyvinyltransferase [Bacteroidota bacterium]
MKYTLRKPNRNIEGTINLTTSKSLSNRALIIRALSGQKFPIEKLAASKDTSTLLKLLNAANTATDDVPVLDTGAAGTTYRFMTAYLALQSGTQVLTGSDRMKQRPIGALVEALNALGADIEYMENEGYPPLRIRSPKAIQTNQLSISASTSSQFISALLMIAPTLSNGLELTLEGKIVSRSYIEMTLRLMEYFGVSHQWKDNVITIRTQKYAGRPYTVEADWSAASYHYTLAAFADQLDLQINGLTDQRIQGDAILPEMGERFGIKTTFNEEGIHLSKSGAAPRPLFEWDFILCPDIAQTLAVMCGGLGVQGLFTGLETLSIKETDRIKALQDELAKVQVWFSKLPPHFSKKSDKQFYMIEGKAVVDNPTFPTYEDHRMAMAFAPLAMLGTMHIEDPMVVVKSYPNFYEDLELLGFEVERMVSTP